jgi:hypothetical protein
MPLPKPSEKQSKEEFISSCMGSDVMNKEFPNNSQRYAVCQSQWQRSKKKNDASWSEIEKEINNSEFIIT